MRHNASKRRLCAIIGTLASLVIVPSCTTTTEDQGEAPPAESVPTPTPSPTEVSKEAASDPSTPAYALRSLDRVTSGHPELIADVSDVRALLNAANKAALGDKAGAQAAWFEALTLTSSGFGKMALTGWLKAYTDNLGHKSDPVVLARLIAAETRNGSVSPYMVAKSLTSDEAILPLLQSTVPQWLTADSLTSPAKTETKAEVSPPHLATLPDGDPLLHRIAVKVCKARVQTSKDWQAWSESLTAEVRAYWQALLADNCGLGPTLAIQGYQQAYPLLAAQPQTLGMAIEAAGRLAALQRANGLRTEAAETYSALVVLWSKSGLLPGALGLSAQAQSLRRIDETLWAARYRALVGDYEHAKVFAQSALDQTKQIAIKRAQFKPQIREQIASLRADAYHTLAFRVAVEQHQFTSALSLTLLGLDTPDLAKDWHERLTWNAGLYDYLDGNFAGARKRWNSLLLETQEEWLQATLKFWLARTSAKLGDQAGARSQVAKLIHEHPLSYYAVVACKEAGLQDGAPQWPKTFGPLSTLSQTLALARDFQLQTTRQSTILRPLLSRAEILTAANLGPFAREAVNELEQALGPIGDIRQRAQLYVYLSRLHFRAGNYLAAINITTKLAKQVPDFWQSWPDQLLIYFAQPFTAEYSYSAEASSVAKEVLLGISRQESGFTPDIRSSANATGLMQLIAPTARRFASELGMRTDPLDELLQEPATNIRLGAQYLKFLGAHFKGFPPAIYAGYNAGEYAVDLWLQRRGHSDPLAFIELIPFGETKDYVKGVWRNVLVYRELDQASLAPVQPGFDLGFAGIVGA